MSQSAQGAELGRLLARAVDARQVDPGVILAGRATVVDRSRSNPVGIVCVDGEPVVVLKAAGAGAAPLDGERAAYRWLGSSAATAHVAPALLGGGDGDGIVTRPVRGAVTLHEALALAPERSPALLARLGGLLGTVHAAPVPDLSAVRPWILGLPRGAVPDGYDNSAAVAAVTDAIRARSAVMTAIATLDHRWTARAAIHGDVKFDNVLVAGDRMLLVDWELAGLGEPAWDLAGVADGLLLPLCLTDATPVSRALVARLTGAAVAAHGAVAPSPAPETLAVAVIARLAQTAVQLAAMSHEQPDATTSAWHVLEAATTLAGECAP
ncbi:MAG TPA: phosphotransferase [Baekduia sp.]|nr:phosphotransferase [Baekduia sp.]